MTTLAVKPALARLARSIKCAYLRWEIKNYDHLINRMTWERSGAIQARYDLEHELRELEAQP